MLRLSCDISGKCDNISNKPPLEEKIWISMSVLFAATSMIQKSVILTAASPQAPNSRTSRTIGFARFAARPRICSRRPRTFFCCRFFSISGGLNNKGNESCLSKLFRDFYFRTGRIELPKNGIGARYSENT